MLREDILGNIEKGLCELECKQQQDEDLEEKKEILEDIPEEMALFHLSFLLEEEHEAWNLDFPWPGAHEV